MAVRCSFCSRTFDTLQQLGGHQTSHRGEMNALRKEHEDHMKITRERSRHELKMVVLPPNPAFWEMYRKYGIEPRVIEFMPVAKKGGERNGMKNYCEITSREVDLTLKL
ncbi:C2H2-type zinc finger [Carex littledalei]|uniref:C2H2-type zinc finger n=1 Tax=Carex littledalei TaxID=544730 RepID=A0A833QZS8_9POAL|nr:C2H2-type zinc finger [Carex littledalei]